MESTTWHTADDGYVEGISSFLPLYFITDVSVILNKVFFLLDHNQKILVSLWKLIHCEFL